MLGMADSLYSISSSSCSRVNPLRHSSCGFTSTNTSAMLKVLGSVPSSGCPALETTVRTSGTVSSALRTLNNNLVASSLDTLDGMSKFTHSVPSSSSGKNSLPKRDPANMASANTLRAMATTWRRCVSAHSSTGRYRPFG